MVAELMADLRSYPPDAEVILYDRICGWMDKNLTYDSIVLCERLPVNNTDVVIIVQGSKHIDYRKKIGAFKAQLVSRRDIK